jgi:serine/threonine protein kinase
VSIEARTRLGPYEIRDQIGAGGMGEVYRATDTNLNRQVAIKVLPAEFAQDTERLVRFKREAKTLASLNHPNIAQIYGFEKSSGIHALVMELVEGPTLGDRIAEGPIPVDEALPLARQIAEALEAAHDQGIIHRDLKPANVKLRPDGTVKVLDFGLAKAMEPAAGSSDMSQSPTLSMAATQSGIILGTAAYMSPEQARGKSVDKRADIWSFGVVLFEMLTGEHAFADEDVSMTLSKVLQQEPDFDRLSADVPARVQQALRVCLQKDPRQRGGDIAAIRLALEGVFDSPTQAAQVVQATSQSKLPWVAAVVLGIIVAGTAAWNLKPDPTPSVNRFYHVLPEGQQFASTRPLVAVSPDGSRLVYVANQQLYLRAMDTLEASPIPGTNETPTAPFFSPDGQWIGYWSLTDGQLKKIALSGGAPVTLTDAKSPFGRPTWQDDGTIVWSQSEGIMQVSANGGEPQILIPVELGNLGNPQMAPDGKSVLFDVGTLVRGVVTVESLESGERKDLFPGNSPSYVSTGHIVYGLDGVLFAVPFDLATLEVTGGPVSLVEGIQDGPMQYALSDSGSLVYVPGGNAGADAPRTLGFVDRNGVVEPLDVRPAPYVQPSLSPDGTRIAVQTLSSDGTGTIWVHDLSGQTQIRLLTQEGNNVRPIWAPDGERVTYASNRDGPRSIYWQTADGRGLPERLTTADEGTVDAPQSWSRDGTTLSFVRVSGGNTGLAATGGLPRLWTLSPDSDAEPELIHDAPTGQSALSPDGQWIAYVSTTAGSGEIFVEPYPPTGLVHQITQAGGLDPKWSSDGDELFFVRPDGELVVVDIATNGPFGFGAERPLPVGRFSRVPTYGNYDVTPDSQRFLVVLPLDEAGTGEPARPQINVVTNWFEELKERVPVP